MYNEQELSVIVDELRAKPAETEIVEFKKASNTFDDDNLGEYFSALSNEANLKSQPHAWLVFGIDNNTHAILGSNYKPTRPSLDEMKKKIADQTTNRITFIEIYELRYEGKRVVMFQIPAAPQGIPMAYKGHYYGRDGESLVALNIQEIEQIRGERTYVDWSAEIVEGATIEDLDPKAIEVARENYAKKHEHLRDEIHEWSDEKFLDNALVTRKHKITNAAIILLGKPQSEVLISPAVSKLRWVLKDRDGMEIDFGIYTCPMILAVEKVYDKIRNLTYRLLDSTLNTLIPDEMLTYEPYVIREAMNNAIAHQDYSKGGMINVVEDEEKLMFTNLGGFLPGTVKNVLENESPFEYYQNKFLAQAMVELHMVDTIGSGIKRMFKYQRRRFFPMPDYELGEGRVKVTIRGRVLDENYAYLLAKNTSLTLVEMELLSKVTLGKPLTDEELAIMRKRKLVEGRKNALMVAKPIAQATGQKASYTVNKGFDDAYYRDLIIKALKQHGSLSRKDVDVLLRKKLPDVLDEKKKTNKIGNILSQLRREGKIKVGVKRNWVLA